MEQVLNGFFEDGKPVQPRKGASGSSQTALGVSNELDSFSH